MKRKTSQGNKPKRRSRCCDCGCTFDQSAGFHFHHSTPTSPHEAEDPYEDRWGKHKPAVGPGDLQDIAHDRQQFGIDTNALDHEVRNLRVGDLVKLCFVVNATEAPWLPAEFQQPGGKYESEAMWVKITAITGDRSHPCYQGELWNIPLLIHPDKLRLGSPVTFEPRHVHTAMPRGRARRSDGHG